jgi:hypothetical protein
MLFLDTFSRRKITNKPTHTHIFLSNIKPLFNQQTDYPFESQVINAPLSLKPIQSNPEKKRKIPM